MKGLSEQAILRLSDVGTAVFVLAAVLSVAFGGTESPGIAVLSIVYLIAGSAFFLWAFFVAVERSRSDAISVGSLFFLSGSAPAPIRRRLLGALAVQVVVALVTASIRPFTTQAFVVLVPVYGLGLAGLWAARFGTFPPRVAPSARMPGDD